MLWYYLYLCILCDRYPLVWAKVMYHRLVYNHGYESAPASGMVYLEMGFE